MGCTGHLTHRYEVFPVLPDVGGLNCRLLGRSVPQIAKPTHIGQNRKNPIWVGQVPGAPHVGGSPVWVPLGFAALRTPWLVVGEKNPEPPTASTVGHALASPDPH